MNHNKKIKKFIFENKHFSILKNKKSQTSHTIIKSIYWFVFLIIVLISIVFLVKGYINTKIDIKEIEAELFYQELLFTNNGIIYKDEITGRSYPGIIDIQRFNKDILDNSISYGKENHILAANITLNYNKDTKYFIYNEEWHKRWLPRAKSRLPGSGGANIILKQSYVLVKENEKLIPGILQAKILYPNK